MGRKNHFIEVIRANKEILKNRFGVKSLSLFGSVARDDDKAESDLDIFVEMPPKIFIIMEMEDFLQNLLECKIDIVRKREYMNPLLLNEIKRDGIRIF
ncbi:MAG: nucleotidyltransferase domain-containing protein [Muribaculaceae bacterium]|nr:nucleotidyltransferase domain-containing protein [Muribaculaceae bacterium]